MVYNQSEESIFNMALAYLKRIDKLLYLCDLYSMKGDIERWNNTLLTLYREISIKLKTEEEMNKIFGDEKTDFNLSDIKNIKVNYENSTLGNINRLCNNPIYLLKYRKYILFLLHNVEIKMRRKMQEKNMLLPSKDDPRRAITQR